MRIFKKVSHQRICSVMQKKPKMGPGRVSQTQVATRRSAPANTCSPGHLSPARTLARAAGLLQSSTSPLKQQTLHPRGERQRRNRLLTGSLGRNLQKGESVTPRSESRERRSNRKWVKPQESRSPARYALLNSLCHSVTSHPHSCESTTGTQQTLLVRVEPERRTPVNTVRNTEMQSSPGRPRVPLTTIKGNLKLTKHCLYCNH